AAGNGSAAGTAAAADAPNRPMSAQGRKGRTWRAILPVLGGLSGLREVLRGALGGLAVLVLIKAAELLFFGSGYYASLTIHPFWIVVILAATLEGPLTGVLAVVMATLLLDRPPRPIGVDITAHYIDMAILPLQWLMVAVCLGFYRAQELRRLTETGQSNRELQEINEALAGEIERLDKAVRDMEIAAVVRGGGNAPAALTALHRAAPADIAKRFAAAAAICVGAPCALYAMEAGKLKLAAAGDAAFVPELPENDMRAEVRAAIHGPDGAILGVVLAPCETRAEAEELLPALEFLAAILSRPLSLAADGGRPVDLVAVGGRHD
ncbi:MAG: hypothetical protein ACK5MQ_00210, partial [Pikeienuella sp.]